MSYGTSERDEDWRLENVGERSKPIYDDDDGDVMMTTTILTTTMMIAMRLWRRR